MVERDKVLGISESIWGISFLGDERYNQKQEDVGQAVRDTGANNWASGLHRIGIEIGNTKDKDHMQKRQISYVHHRKEKRYIEQAKASIKVFHRIMLDDSPEGQLFGEAGTDKHYQNGCSQSLKGKVFHQGLRS